jgi:HK97 family phage major capsid protein
VGNEPKDETPKAGSELKDLISAVHELTQVKIAEATKPAEPGPTDIKTRPDFLTAPADSEESLEGSPALKKGYLPQPLSYADQKANIAKLNFPRGDYDNFSMTRYAFAKQRVEAGFEASDSMQKNAPWETQYYEAAKKIVVTDPVTKAQGDMVSGADGGFLAPEFWSANFLNQLYASQIVTQLPITTMRMGTRVAHMPKLTAAVSISYANENATLATTTASFNHLSFTARKQGEIIQLSNELIRDSVPAADQILQNHAVKWMALDRDKQLILGNGQSGAPVGLANISGIGLTTTTLATNSSPLHTEITKGIVNVETLNGLSTNNPIGMATCTGVLGMPILKQQLLNIVDSNGRPLYDFQGFNAIRGAFPAAGGGMFDGLYGVPTWRFSQVFNEAANSRHIYFGDWQWLIYMVRQDVEIMVSNVAGTSFQNDQTWIRLISRYDVGVAHPEAFFAYTNG